MNKRIVKLDRTALRGLIKEAIQGRQPGSPLWSAPVKKRALQEMPGHGGVHQLGGNQGALEDFVESLKIDWTDMFDEGDPSMATEGREGWAKQVDAAAEELSEKVEQLASEVEERLVNGEFSSSGGF